MQWVNQSGGYVFYGSPHSSPMKKLISPQNTPQATRHSQLSNSQEKFEQEKDIAKFCELKRSQREKDPEKAHLLMEDHEFLEAISEQVAPQPNVHEKSTNSENGNQIINNHLFSNHKKEHNL